MRVLNRISWVVLINVFLVIIAGSVVRMTGSGMGCPDWPKCFGYLIPPTEQDQIEWKENHEFNKGQIIIHDEALVLAKTDFISSTIYNENNWEKYTKHDYAVFNVFHTWTEYINRLFGALLGFVALIMIWFAAKKWKINKWFLGLALIQLFLILFQAWLGKLTVDTNLNPHMITYHMMGVTVMVIVQLLLLKLIRRESNPETFNAMNPIVKLIGSSGIILMLIQIVLGTQVRQQTDIMVKSGMSRELIADGFDWVFLVHRSFSFLIVFSIIFLWVRLWKTPRFKKPLMYLVVFIGLEILAGIILYYFNMQAFAQPIHLLLSILIFAFFVEIFLRFLPRLSRK